MDTAIEAVGDSPARALPALGAAVGLGLLWTLLFRGEPLGLNALLFGIALAAAVLWLGGRALALRAGAALQHLAAALLFAGFLAARQSPWLQALDLGAAIFLLSLFAAQLAGRALEEAGPLEHLRAPLRLLRRAAGSALPLVRAAGGDPRVRGRLAALVLPLLRGALLAVPLLLLFGLLLASADPAFGALLRRPFADAGDGSALGSLGCALAAAAASAGLLGALLRPAGPAAAPGETPARLDFTEGAVLLASLNLLFWSFCAVQVAHLLGGTGWLLAQEHLTLADAAREGFFQLLAVTGLVLVLLLVLRREVRRSEGREERWFRLGCSMLVLLTLAIAATASARLSNYQAAFGATLLRFYSHAFVWLVAAWLCCAGLTLWWQPRRFPSLALGCAVAALAAVNVLDAEPVLVARNLALQAQTGRLDVETLASLSDDAAPALAAALPSLPGEAQRRIACGPLARALAEPRGLLAFNLASFRARAAAARVESCAGFHPGP